MHKMSHLKTFIRLAGGLEREEFEELTSRDFHAAY